MKIKIIISTTAIAVMCMLFAAGVFADENRFELNESYGIREVLNSYVGKRVSLRTDAGEALEGTVIRVGNHLVHISKLSGRDYYDAVVVIDRINSIVFRARGN